MLWLECIHNESLWSEKRVVESIMNEQLCPYLCCVDNVFVGEGTGRGGGASIIVNKYNVVVGLNPIEIVTKICTFFSCLHVVVVFFTCVEIMLVCYSFVVHIFAQAYRVEFRSLTLGIALKNGEYYL